MLKLNFLGALAACVLSVLIAIPSASAQDRIRGTIGVQRGRSVEVGAQYFIQTAEGQRTDILQCGHVNYMNYLQQEVEIEVSRPLTYGVCVEKLKTMAEIRAEEERQRAEQARQQEIAGRTMRRKAIAQRHAPMIYLAPGEKWLPSSIEFFAQYVRVNCLGRAPVENIFALNGNMKIQGDRCNFTTKQALSGPYDQPDWTHGQDPSKTSVPIYVLIYQDDSQDAADPTHDSFYAQYMTLYPYNYGKNACTNLAPDDKCWQSRVVLGNHIADWELMTIRFKQGKPVAVHVGAHGNDEGKTAYTFRAPGWTGNGNPQPPGNPLNMFPVLEWEGEHPVVYSAEGSHGIYGWAGTQNYETTPVGDKLNDRTGKGVRWETWGNIIWYDSGKNAYLLNVYDGRWGNLHMGKSACDLNPLPNFTCGAAGIPTNEYQLNDGPEMPDRRRDKPYMD